MKSGGIENQVPWGLMGKASPTPGSNPSRLSFTHTVGSWWEAGQFRFFLLVLQSSRTDS